MGLAVRRDQSAKTIRRNVTSACAVCRCLCAVKGLDANNHKVCMDCLNGLPCYGECCEARAEAQDEDEQPE